MTDTMRRAIAWLRARGGSGVVDRYGRVLAAGEVATHIDSATWLRLAIEGVLKFEERRLKLSDDERTAA